MSLAPLLARIRAEPNHLYWRWRLLTTPHLPDQTPRAVLLDSLMRLTRAHPDLVGPPSPLKNWTLREAKAYAALFKSSTAAKTALGRATVLWRLSRSAARPAELLAEALRNLDQVPKAMRRKRPMIWGELLRKARPSEFEQALADILKAVVRQPSAYLDLHWVSGWAFDESLSHAARAQVRMFFEGLADGLVTPSVRLRFLEADGLAALAQGDTRAVGKVLYAMAQVAPFDSFPGNHLRLVGGALDKGGLEDACRAFLNAVLSKEWRSWVRPQVEALAAR